MSNILLSNGKGPNMGSCAVIHPTHLNLKLQGIRTLYTFSTCSHLWQIIKLCLFWSSQVHPALPPLLCWRWIVLYYQQRLMNACKYHSCLLSLFWSNAASENQLNPTTLLPQRLRRWVLCSHQQCLRSAYGSFHHVTLLTTCQAWLRAWFNLYKEPHVRQLPSPWLKVSRPLWNSKYPLQNYSNSSSLLPLPLQSEPSQFHIAEK